MDPWLSTDQSECPVPESRVTSRISPLGNDDHLRPGHVTVTSISLSAAIVSDSQTFGRQVKIPTDTRLLQLWRCTLFNKAGELSLTDAGGFHTYVFNLLLFASMIFFTKTFRGSIPGDQKHQIEKNHHPWCFLQMFVEPQPAPPCFNASLCTHTPLALSKH